MSKESKNQLEKMFRMTIGGFATICGGPPLVRARQSAAATGCYALNGAVSQKMLR